MKSSESKISKFVYSRTATALMTAMGLVAMFAAYGSSSDWTGPGGFFFPSPDNWCQIPQIHFAIGVGLSVAVGIMMVMINRTFNVLRTDTVMFLGTFAMMQSATPLIACRLYTSVMLNIVVLGVLATFYSVYQRPRHTRPIFLAFCVLSACSLFDYIFALYALIFLLAFYQMRCPSTRMYLASFMGIAAPWWIAMGFGWADTGRFTIWPHHSIFGAFTTIELVMMLVTVGISVICSILVCLTNMIRIYSYNSKARSISGLLAMLTLYTCLASLVDIANAPSYLSTLNCLTAFQLALFYNIVESRRGYVYVLSLMLIYIVIYFCNICL